MRAALLGLMATFAGVLLFSAPEYLGQYAKLAMPEVLTQPGVQVGGVAGGEQGVRGRVAAVILRMLRLARRAPMHAWCCGAFTGRSF